MNYKNEINETINNMILDERSKEKYLNKYCDYDAIEFNIFETLSLIEIEALRLNEFCKVLNESLEDAKPYIDELKHLEIENDEDYKEALKLISKIDRKLHYNYLLELFNSLSLEMLDVKALFNVLKCVEVEEEED